MRRPLKKKRLLAPDATYQSDKISKFINVLMWDGKKVAARKVVYDALDIIKEGGADPLETFETALRNVGPSVEVRSRRVGGANYQVPREVRPERRNALAIRWLISAVRARKGMPTAKSLAEELTLAAKNEGVAVKKKEDTHKMAESNRAFAHFAW
jgi:small subunit ribosomal protein S7